MTMMLERNQAIKLQDVGERVIVAQSTKTIAARLFPRGPKPVAMLTSWPLYKTPAEGYGGTMDGKDVTSFTSRNRTPVEGYAMLLRPPQGFMVGRIAKELATAGVPNEVTFQMTQDGLALGLMIERALLGSMEMQAEAPPATPYQFRSAWGWLDTGAQAVKPVPDGFRPSAACNLTTTIAAFGENNLEACVTAARIDKQDGVNLTGLVGIRLKQAMSNWGARVTTVADVTQLVQSTRSQADKDLNRIVDYFRFDGGMVRTVVSDYLLTDPATGEQTAASTRSGIFVDPSQWSLDWLAQPAAYMLPDLGGGPRGYHDAICRMRCLSALGQFWVKCEA
jgi:hypothetical protein